MENEKNTHDKLLERGIFSEHNKNERVFEFLSSRLIKHWGHSIYCEMITIVGSDDTSIMSLSFTVCVCLVRTFKIIL